MKGKAIVLGLMTSAFAAVLALTYTPAAPVLAYPSQTSACSDCHSRSAKVKVTVTQVNATTWNYTVTGPYSGNSGFGVFDSAGTKVASGYGASGSFTLASPTGTYTFYGVNKDPSSMKGYSSIQFGGTARQHGHKSRAARRRPAPVGGRP